MFLSIFKHVMAPGSAAKAGGPLSIRQQTTMKKTKASPGLVHPVRGSAHWFAYSPTLPGPPWFHWIFFDLPLASTRCVWSTFSSHFPLSSYQHHWLTSAMSIIVFLWNISGMLGIKPRAAGSRSKCAIAPCCPLNPIPPPRLRGACTCTTEWRSIASWRPPCRWATRRRRRFRGSPGPGTFAPTRVRCRSRRTPPSRRWVGRRRSGARTRHRRSLNRRTSRRGSTEPGKVPGCSPGRSKKSFL